MWQRLRPFVNQWPKPSNSSTIIFTILNRNGLNAWGQNYNPVCKVTPNADIGCDFRAKQRMLLQVISALAAQCAWGPTKHCQMGHIIVYKPFHSCHIQSLCLQAKECYPTQSIPKWKQDREKKKKKARQHKHHHECTRVDNVSELFKQCGWSRFAPKLRPCTSAMHRVKVVWPDQLILPILLPGVIRNAGRSY